jgi:tetratricopeptide (TPR) repeat protein
MAAHSEQAPSLLTTLQAEVASEASPVLLFLVRHTRSIVIGILLFIIAIAGYWVHSWQADKQQAADARELGAILTISDAGQRVSKLQAYLASSPQSLKATAYFAMMEGARQLQDHPKVYDAWHAIGALHPSLKVTADMGMASALAAQNKFKEALAALDGASAGANQAEAVIVNTQIAFYAEVAGDYDRALAACDALLKLPEAIGDARTWTQKKADLEHKKAIAAKP